MGARGLIQKDLEKDQLLLMYESRPGKVVEVRGRVAPSFGEVLQRAEASPKDVMVSAVLEPLKCRLITKGDTYRMWLSRYYQKALWRHLQNFPQFVATSRPLEPLDMITQILDMEKALGLPWRGEVEWVSGDYSAATDGADIRHTKAAFEASITCGLFNSENPPSRGALDVLRSVLYEQKIHYPAKFGIPAFQQVSGQLMGSTLSFPILCVLNVVCYWIAFEQYFGEEYLLDLLPVLINGDDILFRADQEFYALWQSIIVEVGFELSLGKNYIHPNLLTINSQMYRFTAQDGLLTKLGFMNTGLLTGQSKITGRETARAAPVWDYFNETISGCLDPERTKRRFIHYHRARIEELTLKKYNLFCPFERGGFGFNCDRLDPKGEYYTVYQRCLATFLKKELRSDPSAAQKLSLVSDRKRIIHTRWRGVPKLELSSRVGPHARGLFEVREEESITLPPMAEDLDPERPDLKVRYFRGSLLTRFRAELKAGTIRPMAPRNIRHFPFHVLERSEYAPLGRDPQGILSPPEYADYLRLQERDIDSILSNSVIVMELRALRAAQGLL